MYADLLAAGCIEGEACDRLAAKLRVDRGTIKRILERAETGQRPRRKPKRKD
jgi:uncharacterized protein YoaH (UPF0181 family)